MEKVIFQEKVLDFLDKLVFTLFEKGYFGFKESAIEYVYNITFFAKDFIPKNIHKTTSLPLKYLGSYYVAFQANPNTTWYIFFEKELNQYIVTNILNNHQPETRFLNL